MAIKSTSTQDRILPTKSHRGLYLWIGAAVIVAIAVGFLLFPYFARWLSADFSVSRDRVRIAAVERKDLIRDVSLQCKVIAGISPTLYALETGTVTLEVDIGDTVQVDQVLAQIASPDLENLLVREESTRNRLDVEVSREEIALRQKSLSLQRDVDLAEIELTAATRESNRAEEAYQSKAISDFDYQKAQDELQAAKFGYGHAIEYMKLEKERLEFELSTRKLALQQQELLVQDLERKVRQLTVRSPINGVIGTLSVEQKASVVANQPLVSVVDLTRFELDGLVAESYADDLAIGMSAEVLIDAQRYMARVVSISPEVVDNQVSVLMRFNQQTPEGLRQNQRVTARILIEHLADVKVVPRGQFLLSGGGRIAYVVHEGVATKRQIEVGARSLNSVEILNGLDVGEEIVISNSDMFRDADRILLAQ